MSVKAYQAKSADGKVPWGKVQKKPGWRFQEISLSEVPGKHFIPRHWMWQYMGHGVLKPHFAGGSGCSKVLAHRKKAGVLTHPVPKGFKYYEPFLSGYNENTPNIQGLRCQKVAHLAGDHLKNSSLRPAMLNIVVPWNHAWCCPLDAIMIFLHSSSLHGIYLTEAVVFSMITQIYIVNCVKVDQEWHAWWFRLNKKGSCYCKKAEKDQVNNAGIRKGNGCGSSIQQSNVWGDGTQVKWSLQAKGSGETVDKPEKAL